MVDTLPAALIAAAKRFGSKPAYAGDGRVLSFADLLDHVRRTAAGYAAQGVSPGNRVCVWAPNSIDWVIAALAVSYAGATLVPVDIDHSGREAAEIVERTSASLVVVAGELLGPSRIRELTAAAEPAAERAIVDVADLCDLQADADGAIDAVAEAVGPDDIAAVAVDAGTTGARQEVMGAHGRTVGVARTWSEAGGVNSHDRLLVATPFFQPFGFKVGVVTGLLTGATVHPFATFDVEAAIDLIERQRITVLPGTPTIYQSLLSAPGRAERDLSSLRLAVTATAPVPEVLAERMRAAAPDGLGISTVVTPPA